MQIDFHPRNAVMLYDVSQTNHTDLNNYERKLRVLFVICLDVQQVRSFGNHSNRKLNNKTIKSNLF